MAYFSIDGYDSYSGCDIVVTARLPFEDSNENVYFTLGSLQTLSVSTHQDKRPVRSIGNINAKDYVMGQRTIAGSLVFAVFDRHFADKIMAATSVTMADEIPALDLTINFANEYGRTSTMRIFGVKLINEGQVMSINDLYTENTYQFVALGMEPLKANEVDPQVSGSSKVTNPRLIEPYTPTLEIIESPSFQESRGKVISDKIKNDISYSNKEGLVLTSTIEQPIRGETHGIVTLKLRPIQHEGFIYITDLLTNDIIHTIIVNGSELYNIELPVGYYNARYMNTTRTRESNIEKIIIKTVVESEITKDVLIDVFPVIENVTFNSIAVSVYDKSFKSIVCYESGDVEKTLANNNATVTFRELKPDTYYNIFAISEIGESSAVRVKTLSNHMVIYNNFKTYLLANRSMLQNDYDAMIKELDTLLVRHEQSKEYIWPFDNIIDGISMLNDSLIKQELLLYATLYENSLLAFYNEANPYKLNIIQDNIFDTDISIDDWSSIKYYSKNNNKSKLEGVLTQENVFVGRPNKSYYLYGIDANKSSVKKYLSVFSAEGKEFLAKYKDIEKYKLLDLEYYKSFYPNLSIDELYSLAIRDNHFCDKELLEEPYIYIEGDQVIANVDYSDKILSDTYYLCISEIHSTLDVIPKRKIPFNKNTKEIYFSDYLVSFDFDKLYHAWIENSQSNIVSRTFVFNYKESALLEAVLNKELFDELNRRKRAIQARFENNEGRSSTKELNKILEDIVNIIYSDYTPKKDYDTSFEFNMLKYSTRSNNLSEHLELLFDVVMSNINNRLNINRMNQLLLDKKNERIRIQSGSDLDVKVVTKSYNLDDDNVSCSIYNTDTFIPIRGDYMTVYLINEHINKILGMMVLECATGQFKEVGFNIKEGDK